MALTLIVGCDGCNRDPQADKPATTLQPPYTVTAAKAMPTTRPDAGSTGMIDGAVKPGHWTAASMTLRSNRDDRRGEVQTRVAIRRNNNFEFSDGSTLEDLESVEIEIAGEESPTVARSESTAVFESILFERPAVLPKGQMRRLETRLLVPEAMLGQNGSVDFGGSFSPSGVSEIVPLKPAKFAALQPQAYFFVILTDRPERFTRLQTADWVRPLRPDGDFRTGGMTENYKMIIPPTDGLMPLADTALDWTSTAVLLWDDVPARALTPSQRTAIADWVRFGGTLIVNGPSAADALADDALASCLLIQSDGNIELDAQAAAALVDSMAVSSDASTSLVKAQLADGTPRVSLAGKPIDSASPIGEGGLVWEGAVGRGRVVQSRFDLLSDWATSWKSFDSFFNGGVLRRPARTLVESRASMFGGFEDESSLRHVYTGYTRSVVPPDVNTRLRIYSRDARMARTAPAVAVPTAAEPADPELESARSVGDSPTRVPMDDYRDPFAVAHPISGMAGWKSDSEWMLRCRENLRREIGVTIPKSSLVIRSLAIYLAVLIPINYLIFRLIGRLEWAWLAVVPIAIAGAFFITRAASLDVGFVRSRNEIALLELHAGYDRAHLTRVTGLYNSLASGYTIAFDSPDVALAVLETGSTDDRNAGLFGKSVVSLVTGAGDGPQLNGFSVGSNSFGELHAEQFVSTGGGVVLKSTGPDGWQIQNQTNLDLADVLVVHRPLVDATASSDADVEGDLASQVRVAVVGGCSPGQATTLRMRPIESASVPGDLPMGVSDLMGRLIDPSGLPPGSMRLIGRIDAAMDGMTIDPPCRQTQAQTIVIAHLLQPSFPPVAKDTNLIGDFRRKQTNPMQNDISAEPEPQGE